MNYLYKNARQKKPLLMNKIHYNNKFSEVNVSNREFLGLVYSFSKK